MCVHVCTVPTHGLNSKNTLNKPNDFTIDDMSYGFSMKNQSGVKEQGKHSNFEPIRASLLLSDWPIFSQERTEGV